MRPMMAASLALLASAAWAQDQKRATIATQKGDVVEGLFRGATETEITIEVAGQPIRLPLHDVRYVSFVGRVDAAPGGPAPGLKGSMEDAFGSLSDLGAALRVGVLRTQYSEKLVEALPRVMAFLDSPGEDWPDVRRALGSAVAWYKAPLGEITRYRNPWEGASTSFGRAGLYVKYAQELAAKGEEKSHRESPDEMELQLGADTKGRLGTGDRLVPKDMDAESEGQLVDVYALNLMGTGKLTITVKSAPCDTKILLVDSSGRKMGEKEGELKRDIKLPGKYRVWVVTQGGVGLYVIKAALGA